MLSQSETSSNISQIPASAIIRSLAVLIAVVCTQFSGLSVVCQPVHAVQADSGNTDRSADQASPSTIVFSRDVLPILSENCFMCHGPDEKKREAQLRLDTEAGAHSVINIEAPTQSLLVSRINSQDEDTLMPPPSSGKSLTPAQIAVLQEWISAGAPWGRHWSFEPVSRPNVPSAEFEGFPAHNPVDAFVQKTLATRGLTPSAEADRATLIRRVTLDLIGLPPTESELEDFLNDTSPEAYTKLVDRLLSSPHFGERFAWDWLDAARYADSNGYQGDGERTMWPWRDWVVDAFNSNLSFDEFTRWQLAGDLLPGSTEEQQLATAFCRNHMINGEGGRIPEENRVDYVMDMTETMGTVWLGLTLNCCRCHDHKFDPLSQKNYYEFFAFFNQTPIDGSGGNPQTPPVLQITSGKSRRQLESLNVELKAVEAELRNIEEQLSPGQSDWEQHLLSKGVLKNWELLKPISASAKTQTLSIAPTGRILASGDNPAQDSYVIQLSRAGADPAAPLRSLRLDTLRHPTMTAGGLARSDSGNFVLSELRAFVTGPDSQMTPLLIRRASATFEQGALTAASSLDGKPETGWAVYEGRPVDKDHAIIFEFESPLVLTAGQQLRVELDFASPHARHNAGYFQFWASTSVEAQLPSDSDFLIQDVFVPASERTQEQIDRIRLAFLSNSQPWKELRNREAGLRESIKSLRDSSPRVMVMEDRPEGRPTFILNRGLYNEPTTIEVQPQLPEAFVAPPNGSAQSARLNRLELANWLISEEQPLTPRVIVNRYWQQFFGMGLVRTGEDFGVQSEYPPQKDLLDWLAADFRESGWDVHRLIRTIVTSHTYRQSSVNRLSGIRDPDGRELRLTELDPENRLLARASRFRMPSWMLRDQVLAVSGLLNREIGGPPVNTYQPEGVWEEATFGTKRFTQDQAPAIYRRSLYVFWRRIVGPTIFFDNATRQTCMVKTLRTNTPLHSLLTLNETTWVESARVMADSILSNPGLETDDQRIGAIFRRVLCRPASPEEQAVVARGLQRTRVQYAGDPKLAKALLSVGAAPRSSAANDLELAAWTNACLAILNLDEALNHE